jgi:hypothetical protein
MLCFLSPLLPEDVSSAFHFCCSLAGYSLLESCSFPARHFFVLALVAAGKTSETYHIFLLLSAFFVLNEKKFFF